MASLSFTSAGNASTKIDALVKAVQSQGGLTAGSEGVRVAVQRHFISLPPNAKGWRSSGFWGAAAESVTATVDGMEAIVAATKVGVRRRFFGTGGPIAPNQFGNSDKKYFAVPNQEEAAGKYASDYPKDALKFVFAQDENGRFHAALVPRGPVAARGDRGVSGYSPDSVMYWLYRTINQLPNPNVLPTFEELYDAYGKGLLEFIRAKMHNVTLQVSVEGIES